MKYYISIDEFAYGTNREWEIIKVPKKEHSFFRKQLKEEEFRYIIIEISRKQYNNLYNRIAIGNEPKKLKYIYEN